MSPKNGKTNSGQSYSGIEAGTERSRPILHQKAREIQPYNKIAKLPIGLDEEVCARTLQRRYAIDPAHRARDLADERLARGIGRSNKAAGNVRGDGNARVL